MCESPLSHVPFMTKFYMSVYGHLFATLSPSKIG